MFARNHFCLLETDMLCRVHRKAVNLLMCVKGNKNSMLWGKI